MRYVRFLKTPRVVTEKGTDKHHIHCLVTITSDLGDSLLPYDVQLSAEVLLSNPSEKILVWKTAHWSAGMRSLSITFPSLKSRASLRVRVGVEPKSAFDEYHRLCDQESRGIVSAWSAPFTTSSGSEEAVKLVERRFRLPNHTEVHIWEETGESIARHLWDAGISLSCHLNSLLDKGSLLATALLPSPPPPNMYVMELGTGCGIVGIAIAQVLPGTNVLLTDLPEAQEIVDRNMKQSELTNDSKLRFEELDWSADLPLQLQLHVDLILAADCTYNADSSPALVSTFERLAKLSPRVKVAVAMKMRHSSEEVFFDLMSAAGFRETHELEYPLPGDAEVGEEIVYLHVYQMESLI